MKPGARDQRHQILICGDELRELKRHTYSMVEAFGLDNKIDIAHRPIAPGRKLLAADKLVSAGSASSGLSPIWANRRRGKGESCDSMKPNRTAALTVCGYIMGTQDS